MINPLFENGIPVLMEHEILILRYDNIIFKIETSYHENCVIFLSNLRIVVHSKDYSFDIPLLTLHDECFNQPIFCANNFTAKTPMIGNEDEIIQWKIIFPSGTGVVIPLLFCMINKIRKDNYKLNNTIQTQDVTAFVDPADTSILYVSCV